MSKEIEEVPTISSLRRHLSFDDDNLWDVIHNLNGFIEDTIKILESNQDHKHEVEDV